MRDQYEADNEASNPNRDYETFGRDIWARIVIVFENEDLQVFTIDFWAYALLRFFTALFIVFVVFPLGLISAGWLWRKFEMLFTFFIHSYLLSIS